MLIAMHTNHVCRPLLRSLLLAGLTLMFCGGFLPAAAESLFAREALGEWLDGYDLRGETLGSTGIGTIDPHNFSSLNPASGAWTPFVQGYFAMQGAVNWTEDGTDTARRSSGLISGLGLSVPVNKQWALRFMLRPQTDGTYRIQEMAPIGSDDPDANRHIEEGSRGLLSYSADLTYHGRTWAVGLRGGLLAGSLLDQTSYELSDSGWVDTEDRRTLRCEPTVRYGAGFQWSPIDRVTFGAMAILGQTMELEETFTAPAGTEWTTTKRSMDHPRTYGAGLSYFLNRRFRVSADVVTREWEELKLSPGSTPATDELPLRNTTAWGIGVERVPAEPELGLSFVDRVAWRAGFAFIPWYAQDAGGNPVDERRYTFGIGIPIKHRRGSLDFLIAYGQRGSVGENGIAEEYVRMGLAAVFGAVPREY